MIALEYDNVNEMYRDVVRLLLKEKSNNGARELRNVMINIKNVDGEVITERGISVPYLCAELLWYMCGSEDVNFIGKFAKKWLDITDNGVTSNSAYGHIIQKRHGFNQLEKVIELLKKDKHSRRAVINLNVPNENVIETKDEICTIALQFLIRDEKLHCTAIMRSNDIYTGTPYDIAFFTSLQAIIAKALSIPCGEYTHFVTSLHLYDSSLGKLTKAMLDIYVPLKIESSNLLSLTDDDYEQIRNSASPKTDILTLFTQRGIIKTIWR